MPLDHNLVIQALVDLQRAGLRLPPGPALEALVAAVFECERAPTLLSVLFRLAKFGRYGSLEPPEPHAVYALDVFEMGDYERAHDEVYAEIAQRVAAICGDALPLRVLGCSQSTVTVSLDGQRYRFVYEVEDDWVDGTIFSDLAALLAQRGARTRLVHAYGGEVFIAVPVKHLHTLAALVQRHLVADHPRLLDTYGVRHVVARPERVALARREA